MRAGAPASFKKALEEFPNVKLLASQPANYQRLAALTDAIAEVYASVFSRVK